MGKNSYLQPLVTPFPTKSDVTPQLMGTAFRKLAAAFRSYIKKKKKEIRKKEQELVPTAFDHPISYQK